ncbi:MAG: nucleotidyltransferase family protein [Acidobacteria bacterium]|nr:nucleotidyltransferase family protein [Acidobacteriota bacterium]MBP8273970.1 nucleotidyltransferase family protein [Acidobacteriota bacterium]
MSSARPSLSDIGNSAVGRALVSVVHLDPSRINDGALDALGDSDWDQLVTIAAYQRVRPLLHERLLQSGRWQRVPPPAWQRLVAACRDIAIRKMHMHAELSALLSALGQHGVPAIVLKGAYLGPAVYENLALREMNDLDVMVPIDRLALAVDLAQARGYAGVRAFDVEADTRGNHHVTRLIKQPFTGLEFHWNITPPLTATTIDPALLWNAARPVRLGNVDALALSPTDLLLHVCFHQSFLHQFEFGLRPSCDIARVIEKIGPTLDWAEVVRQATERGWSRGVGVALHVAKDLAGANVPHDVLQTFGIDDLPGTAALATQLVWALPDEGRDIPISLAPLGGGGSLDHNLRAITRRVFLPRPHLTGLYGVSADARWWWLLYGYRIVDLVRRRATDGLRLLLRRSTAATDLSKRRNLMRNWLTAQRPDDA